MKRLFERSEEFEAFLAALFEAGWWYTLPIEARHRASIVAARLSAEHGRAAKLLLLHALCPQSGAALLRLQFEALLRAVWVLHCASEDQVAKLTKELSAESEQAAKNLPGPIDMLGRIAAATPVGLHQPLVQFHDSSWRALNSFVHAGIHPVSRGSSGFPVQLAETLVRHSNGLMHIAYRVQASFLGAAQMDAVTQGWLAYRDVLPPITLGS